MLLQTLCRSRGEHAADKGSIMAHARRRRCRVTIPPPRAQLNLFALLQAAHAPLRCRLPARGEKEEATMVHTKAENGAFSLYLGDKVAISRGERGRVGTVRKNKQKISGSCCRAGIT